MKISTKTMVTVGMFTAILAVLSIITIPMPSGVPITLQTFAVALCGYVLGYKRGTAATLIYILVGSVGMPVFAGMTGGPSWLVSYSGGFIWGFIFLTLLCGIRLKRKHAAMEICFGMIGIIVCHIFGVLQFSIVASSTLSASFLMASAPYIIKDVISAAGAYLVSLPIRRALMAGNILTQEGNIA